MHAKTAYHPHVDEFVYLRQAFRNVVVQVTAVNHERAEIIYHPPDDKDETRMIKKWVALKMLLPYDVAVPDEG